MAKRFWRPALGRLWLAGRPRLSPLGGLGAGVVRAPESQAARRGTFWGPKSFDFAAPRVIICPLPQRQLGSFSQCAPSSAARPPGPLGAGFSAPPLKPPQAQPRPGGRSRLFWRPQLLKGPPFSASPSFVSIVRRRPAGGRPAPKCRPPSLAPAAIIMAVIAIINVSRGQAPRAKARAAARAEGIGHWGRPRRRPGRLSPKPPRNRRSVNGRSHSTIRRPRQLRPPAARSYADF
jgi:hypothetical protein